MEPNRVDYPLQSPRGGETVRLLSWNAYHSASPRHADKVLQTLASLDCDILCLYELRRRTELPRRIHQLGYGGLYVEMNYRHMIFVPVDGGAAFFSRYPIEGEPRVVQIREDGIFYVRRYYIEVKVRLSPTYVLTVGMIHHTLPWEYGYRGACDALVQEVSEKKERYLFVGDLNSLPRSRLIKELSEKLVPLGPPIGESSHTTLRWWRTPLWAWRVDYAFATPDVAALLVEPVKFETVHPSDHHPINVHLRIP